MKTFKSLIQEGLKIGKNWKKNKYSIELKYYPNTKEKLHKIIEKRIKEEGNECNLNDIDVSKITNMSYLFSQSNFNGDISQWDVSQVETMDSMFAYSKFNQDISHWNVSKVEDMSNMFYSSKFNQDISQWDISNVEKMQCMFSYSKFNQDISNWDMSNVINIDKIFYKSPLQGKELEWWYRKK